MSIREALGGRWATHWLVWVALFPPTTLLVLVRNAGPQAPDYGVLLLSATVQHLAVGVIVLGGGSLLRVGRALLSLAEVALLWLLAAAARGLIAGTFANATLGVEPEFALRILAWIVASVVWVPAVVYVAAQIDRRRLLLGELEYVEAELANARVEVLETADEVQQRLARTVRESVGPVLADLQRSLAAMRGDLSGTAFAEISLRLSRLHDDTARLVEASGEADASPIAPTWRPAPLRRAIELPRARPWTTALLVAVATLSLVLIDAWRRFGTPAVLEIVIATTLSALTLAVVSDGVRRTPWGARQTRLSVATLALASAALVMSYTMLNSGIDAITWHGIVLLPLLLLSLVSASMVYAAASVLAAVNRVDRATLDLKSRELGGLRQLSRSRLDHERSRLSALMHGPIQGRLAACVMALNFHGGPDADPARLAPITEQVLEHLSAASRDLASLTASMATASTTDAPPPTPGR